MMIAEEDYDPNHDYTNDTIKRPGYKHTKLGWIPVGWEFDFIKNISKVVRGSSPRPAGDPKFFGGSHIPWLTVAALTNIPESSIYVDKTFGYLTEAGAMQSRTLLEGTVILANSGATLGVAKILAIKCCANDGIAAFLNLSNRLDRHYLTYFLNSKTKYYREVVAPGNGQPNLNTDLIGITKIPLPPLPEQQKIAQILSTWDRAISKIEQLIAKKQESKRGLMQQLLTGKKRFKEFDSEWKSLKLRDLIVLTSGSTKPDSFKEVRSEAAKIPVFGGNGVSGYCNDHNFEINTIVIGRVGEYCGVVHQISGLNWVTDNALVVKDFKRDCNVYFLSELLSFLNLSRLRNKGGQPLVSQKPIYSLKITIPTVEEQLKIASVLSSADQEITKLQTQLDKLKEQKKGLMQKLLTGEVRVTVDKMSES